MTRMLRAAVAAVFFASLHAGALTGTALAQSSSMSSSASMKGAMSCPSGESYVKGYTKADGTKVAGYCRKSSSSASAAMTCPKGETYVKPYKKADGTMVKGYCRKSASGM
jgi:hypothetical protein